ncbi:uncharacterized protein LOC34619385 [Cyclospora cayetanensis]|uniref:Uncharacterized protein LOC34619385 n=2 Tax=Cyclospora cayetanensis TaxID=88456 RepID=A0A6P5WCN4_9EIME|nr:uncharacterized protein LOC34619385 [Cyclospora cayetanensis]OEH75168.1 EF hand domain-containing protein [Cyclospora cayetanensis]
MEDSGERLREVSISLSVDDEQTGQHPLLQHSADEESQHGSEDYPPKGDSKSPEIQKDKEIMKAALARGHLMARKAARKGYEKSKLFVANQYTLFKQDAKRGPKIIRWMSIVACILLLPGIFVDLITMALTLSPAEVLTDIYGILGSVLVLAAEFSRKSTRFGVRAMLHYYVRFVEFSAGRGMVQLYVASTCVSLHNLLNLLKFLPGVALLLCGIVNIIWGTYAACKLNSMLARLRDAEGGDVGSKPMTEQLDLIERKFEAMDRRGDGLLSKDDLREAVVEMNLMMDALELDAVFEYMDKDGNGFISKDEFESWWLANKGVKVL